jgi:hypothetical protein
MNRKGQLPLGARLQIGYLEGWAGVNQISRLPIGRSRHDKMVESAYKTANRIRVKNQVPPVVYRMLSRNGVKEVR